MSRNFFVRMNEFGSERIAAGCYCGETICFLS